MDNTVARRYAHEEVGDHNCTAEKHGWDCDRLTDVIERAIMEFMGSATPRPLKD